MGKSLPVADGFSETRNHWWWRDGWGIGTRYLTWHFVLNDQVALYQYTQRYREVLIKFGCFDFVPSHGLHLTTQGFGFEQDIPPALLAKVLDVLHTNLRGVSAFKATAFPPKLFPETVFSELKPRESFVQVRNLIRTTLSQTLEGFNNEESRFTPHVSIAYCNKEVPAEPIREALESLGDESLDMRISHVDLILLNRDNHEYAWDVVDTFKFD